MRPLALLVLAALTGCKTASGTAAATDADPCRDITAAARASGPALEGWREGQPATDAQRPALVQAARDFLMGCGPAEAERLTAELVRFPTVSARESPSDGPAFAAMRAHLERWAAARGFTFEATGDNGAWIVSTSSAAAKVAFVLHADVVPVDAENTAPQSGLPPGWSHPPFEVTRVGDRLYGRGTEDDKGPIAAVLVTLHTLARFGLLPDDAVQAILGTGEESDWSGMRAFVNSRPQPPNVISLDASYPVVIAESGFVAWSLEIPRASTEEKAGCVRALEVDGGQFLTQVPGEAHLDLNPQPGLQAQIDEAATRALARLGDARLRVETKAHGDRVRVHTFGDAVHSSEADAGANAMWALAATAAELPLCEGAIRDALHVVDRHFAGDHWGARLGLAYQHEVMGRLLVIPTVLRTDESKVVLRINMRRPAGRSKAEFSASLDAALKVLLTTAPELVESKDGRYVGDPALVDPASPLVTTLMEIYRDVTGDAAAQPKSIRGGTYARLFDGAVSFGPALPGHTYRGHAPDEYLEQEALEIMLRTSFEAVLRLSR